MKKNFIKKISLTLVIALLACVCLPGMAANPGSNDDPLVSLSYVNSVLMPQIRGYVDSQMLYAGGNYKVVNVQKGQTIIGSMSTQFILRMGTASVVATQKGGLADVTAGVDLPLYSNVAPNHLLIVPFEDWRGITMHTDGIVLVSGAYSIH